jgi:hypothetical protein
MSQNEEHSDANTRGGYLFVSLWAAGIILLYAIGGYLGVRQLQGYKAETERFRQAAVGAPTIEPGVPSPATTLPAGARPTEVHVGIYINRIGEFSLKESGWTADLDLWFRWTGEGLKPGETFQVVNGQIDRREKKESYVRGREHYERYRVKARLTDSFDFSRFPFGDQVLTIRMEESVHEAKRLRYVADEQGSLINRSGVPQNLKITKSLVMATLHSYGPERDDSRSSSDAADVHSQLVFAMLLSPPGTALYIRLLQALFVSVAIAFIVFFIKPIFVEPRFGLGVGAIFAAVGNNIYVGAILPAAEGITLIAMVNAVGLVTVFLTLVQSAISLYILDTMGQEKLRLFFDKLSFVVFFVGYAVVNLMLPLAARP